MASSPAAATTDASPVTPGMSPGPRRVELPPTRVPVTVGSFTVLRHLDTIVAQPNLPDSWSQSSSRPPATAYSSTAYQRIVMDRFDMAAVASGALPLLAPVRVLPVPGVVSTVATPIVAAPSTMTNTAHKGAYVATETAKPTRTVPFDPDLVLTASSARPSHTLQAPSDSNPTSTCGASQYPVSAVLEPGVTILWTLHPTTFSMHVIADDDAVHSTSEMPFASGPPAHVQLHSITFNSRCTAACTFTTHSDWNIATGHRRPTAAGATPQGMRSRTSAPTGAWTTTTPDRPTRPQTADVNSVQPQVRHEPVRNLDDTPVFSPAAEGDHQSSSSLRNTQNSVILPPISVPPPADNTAPIHDLWTAFGFVNGDIILWNHAQRSMIKRHNSSKLSTRVVGNNASVTAIARVDRFHSSGGGGGGASSSASSSQQLHANRLTHIFGDMVVGFDNGSFLIVRLNLTGGFIDDDSVAWLGHFPLNRIRCCPVAPQLVAMACGDGILRFLDTSNFSPQTASITAADLGTSRDERLLFVTPILSQHGGLMTCDWLSDGTALVTGGQDDAVTYVGVTLFNTGASRTHTPDSVPNVESGGRLVSLTDSIASRPGTAQQTHATRTAADISAVPPNDGSRPPPVVTTSCGAAYLELHTIVRRPFHRGWVRSVTVVPIATDAVLPSMQSPTDDVSVASYDAVNVGGMRDTPAPQEISHLVFCSSEDGSTSIWHLPNADQLANNNSVAGPLLRATSMTPMARQVTNNSFTPSVSRPTSAGFALTHGSWLQGNLSMASPAGNQTTPGRWAVGGAIGCAVPGVIGRQPSSMLNKFTRSVPIPTSGGGRAVEFVLEDAFLCVVALPLAHRLLGSSGTVPNALAGITAKGKCVVWSLSSTPR